MNNYDMTWLASALANWSAAPPVHPSSEPSRLTSLSNPPPQPDKRRRGSAFRSPDRQTAFTRLRRHSRPSPSRGLLRERPHAV